MQKEADKITKEALKILKDERLRQGISHEKLALLAGVHRSTIGLIESGKRMPTLRICNRISTALGLKLSSILKKAE